MSFYSVKFTFFSIPSALLTWSVNQTSPEQNSILSELIIVKECGQILLTVQIGNKIFDAR